MYSCQNNPMNQNNQTPPNAGGLGSGMNPHMNMGCAPMMGMNSPMGNCCPPPDLKPIVLPCRVQTKQNFELVEQPIICPVECRQINNIVPVPRYYPSYTHTCCNNY